MKINEFDQLSERRSLFGEIKEQAKLFFMYRRYEKFKAGERPWEDRVLSYVDNVRHFSMREALKLIMTTAVHSWRRFIKRTFDIVLSFVGIVLCFPVFLFLGILIKFESRGPILYKQTRVGLRGKFFNMYKFRTMVQNAETVSGPVWAQKSDSRVTRFGAFLRKTHLDELPQLFNILRGDMSLVGPRPERPFFVRELRKYIPHYDRRLCVKPGLTGLAQIMRRYDESVGDVKKKVRYDVFYIRKMCPLLDLTVLLLTVRTVIAGNGR